MADSSSDIRHKIVSLTKNKPMSVSELSRQLKMRREFVAGYLEALRHMGELKVISIGKSKVYTPAEKAK